MTMTNEIRELHLDELDAVSGGNPKASTPPKQTPPSKGIFEIEDFSFNIEQVLN